MPNGSSEYMLILTVNALLKIQQYY